MSGVPFQIGSWADRTFGTKREGLVAGATVRWLRPVRGSQACLKSESPGQHEGLGLPRGHSPSLS
jgi:hypothetical protein